MVHMRAARAFLLRFTSALRSILGLPVADADSREEFESHLVMHVAENMRRGMSAEEARRVALLAAGGLPPGAEAVREQRGLFSRSARSERRQYVNARPTRVLPCPSGIAVRPSSIRSTKFF